MLKDRYLHRSFFSGFALNPVPVEKPAPRAVVTRMEGERARSIDHALSIAREKYPVYCQRISNGRITGVSKCTSEYDLLRQLPLYWKDTYVVIRSAGSA